MNIIPFHSPDKANREQVARIRDVRFYRLLEVAVNIYKTFSKSLNVRGCAFGYLCFCVFFLNSV
jgi:hypothetical protein